MKLRIELLEVGMGIVLELGAYIVYLQHKQ